MVRGRGKSKSAKKDEEPQTSTFFEYWKGMSDFYISDNF
jgi:hypothetical protein